MDKKKIVSSLAYKFTERLGVKGLGLVISVVLARMLAPEEFGQLAIMSVFINLSQVIVEGGFTTALIQRRDVTERDYSTVFYINALMALICFLSLQLAAPWISRFYNQNITAHLRVYSFSVFFGAFNALQLARLQKRMEFRKIMRCSLTATLISGIAGIAGAYLGLGLWALVLYNMTSSILLCITAAFAERWLPEFAFSLDRAGILFSYGWKMFVSAILCSLYNDIRSLVIGKKYSGNDLAYYNRGQQFPHVISHTLDSSIQSVMFPAMASVQDEQAQLGALLQKSVTMGSYLVFPLMLGLAAVSEPVVALLLTEKWLPCVPYMQWLCLANAAVPVISSNLIAIKASGRSDIYMRLELLRRVVMLVILAVSIVLFDSPLAIAVSFCFSNWLDAWISSLPMRSLTGYGSMRQARDLWKNLLAACIMYWGVISLRPLFRSSLLLLATQVLAGLILYPLLCALLGVKAQRILFHACKGFTARKK